MKRVEIFKTNVYRSKDAQQIVATLVGQFSSYKINFDLDDEEHILRIESSQLDIETSRIIKQMFEWGYRCERIE
ncbi:methyltransferase type 11 [Sphingobacterium sp. N143]|uniref:methyltransferase type 11 n=1 Tax=Sphingobacterium sp. N143 TaxID=2746727 RepID=UPI002577D7AF|nr:methyltransferase type 11 [Sphingobacterium sp. N143]MDM1294452.1 methyltransferase type 11 [Sphingobacterium sp. N143]